MLMVRVHYPTGAQLVYTWHNTKGGIEVRAAYYDAKGYYQAHKTESHPTTIQDFEAHIVSLETFAPDLGITVKQYN